MLSPSWCFARPVLSAGLAYGPYSLPISLSLPSLQVTTSRKPSLTLLNECVMYTAALLRQLPTQSHVFSITMLMILLSNSSVSCLIPSLGSKFWGAGIMYFAHCWVPRVCYGVWHMVGAQLGLGEWMNTWPGSDRFPPNAGVEYLKIYHP